MTEGDCEELVIGTDGGKVVCLLSRGLFKNIF
jgi:hypothetical protein